MSACRADAEAVEQRTVAATLLREPAPGRLDDRGELPKRAGKLLINNNIFEATSLREFRPRRLDPLLDHLGAVLAPALEAATQLRDRWRRDEDQDRIRELPAYLHGALPVD